MWREAGLRWKDFLPEEEDVNKFVTEQVIDCSPRDRCGFTRC